ncbi:MAG: sialate O-acetylesterase [Clostridia bacterium]|nr:sialate O-acetylesterase [Clostridia bacterium]
MIHSVLIIGQSNMAGRGFQNEVEPINNERLKVLRNGRWQDMFFPVNPDRPFSGICLAESFADIYSKEKDVDVGIIPCADGGTSLDQWQPSGLLFDHACYMSELASRTSTISAVLWHQGEADCSPHLYPLYEKKLTNIINEFRKRLNLYDVPFLLGGLGDFLPGCTLDDNLANYIKVNDAIKNTVAHNDMTGFVSAEGLESNPDNLHFSAKALREFGVRYYNEFVKIEDKNKVFVEKRTHDQTIINSMERL